MWLPNYICIYVVNYVDLNVNIYYVFTNNHQFIK